MYAIGKSTGFNPDSLKSQFGNMNENHKCRLLTYIVRSVVSPTFAKVSM